jgi:cobalt-zinc-cadmium efflux system protein
MSHDHHHHSQIHGSGKNLKTAFFLNLGFTLLELIGGWYVNSVAIYSDAIHDLGDTLSLGTSWWLEKYAQKKPSEKYSFGYRRFSLLGALINAVVLIVGTVFVIREAVIRLISPEFSDPQGMIILAVFGVAVNGYAAWKLSKGKTMNEKVLSWHLVEDVLGWIAVLLAALILLFYPTPYLDPGLSLAISIYILWNVVKRLIETLDIFLQKSPSDIKVREIEKEILAFPHVHSLHHTHIWSLDGARHVFTTHVKLKGISSLEEIIQAKEKIHKILRNYPFEHFTVETELESESCALDFEE